MLSIVRANKSRGGGPWPDDDYDVYDGERVVGRIFLHPQAPHGRPWFWSITGAKRNRQSSIRGTRRAKSRRWRISRRNG